MTQARDYTGQTIGQQLVLGRSPEKPSGYWQCECQGCGKITDKWTTYLKKLATKGGLGCRCGWGVGSKMHLRQDGIKAGERFDRLVATGELVRRQCGKAKNNVETFAQFECDCGRKVWKRAATVRSGATRSCGCIVATKGGTSKAKRDRMFWSAKQRAKKLGIPFDITIDDVVVPERCPVLGIEIKENPEGGCFWDHSPSLDKIIPSLGYVRGNIAVISWKANRLKGEGTLSEILAVADYIKKGARLAA